MLSDCVDDNGVLLPLLLKKVVSSNFWEAKDVGEIGMLISSELCDVTFRDVFESHLLLHFFELSSSLA